MLTRRAPLERSTPTGAVFETTHRGCSTLRYHRHGYAYATIVLRGAYTEVRDGLPERFLPASVVVHGPQEEHADYFMSDAHCLNVELQDEHLAGASVPARSMCANVRVAVDAVIRSFYDLVATERGELAGAVASFQSALQARPTSAPVAQPKWLADVLDRFAWPDAVPLGAAARIAGLHQTHFSRAFHRHVGMTPHAFRVQARVRLASEMLLTSSVPIAQVGLRCGFADQAHFTRTFGRNLGVTPAKYRQIFER